MKQSKKLFAALLALLRKDGWEVKPGKHCSLRRPGQARFKRLDSLGDGYTEDALRAVLAGQQDGQEGDGQTLRDITVILDYTVNTNHTGMYVEQKMGFYEEQGLDVTIVEPADGVTPTLIATGKGDFGVTYQEDLTYALSRFSARTGHHWLCGAVLRRLY